MAKKGLILVHVFTEGTKVKGRDVKGRLYERIDDNWKQVKKCDTGAGCHCIARPCPAH